MGDAHRHTDIRGHSGVDGSVLDTYRYAMDAAQLDWLGTADHNEVIGGRWPDGLRDYQWWYTQKMVDVMTHAPAFIGVYSYEHSMASPAGHRNILFLKRGAPLRPIDRSKTGRQPAAQPVEMDGGECLHAGRPEIRDRAPHLRRRARWPTGTGPTPASIACSKSTRAAAAATKPGSLPEKEKRGPTQTDRAGPLRAGRPGPRQHLRLRLLQRPRLHAQQLGRRVGRSPRTAPACSRPCTSAAPTPPPMRSS